MDSVPSLAAAAAAGDATAVNDLLEKVWPDAFRIAWSVLGERTAAEDAAQEACARTLTAIGSLRTPEAFPAWFYRIVVNEANRRRRTLRNAAAAAEEPRDTVEAVGNEERIDLERALHALEPPLRVVIVLRYYLRLSGKEIATIVGASAMTVRWRLFVARRRLRATLSEPTTSPRISMHNNGAYADEPQAVR
ncbi:MAG: sigma-70 family RNA polymerase sigma factor [Candidatus Eremiobacteraeota bacterium]|nr:sigma-70 family RNA polymerase sigma factor [Candidatus Eremiobacteraeota bacterium]